MSRRYPDRPIAGVGAVVFKDDYVLLVRRGKPPLSGEWSIPGGGQREDESIIDALKREIREECGIDVYIKDLVGLYEYIEREKDSGRVLYHYIVFDFLAEYRDGSLTPGSDVDDARWVPMSLIESGIRGDRIYKLRAPTEEMILEAWKFYRES